MTGVIAYFDILGYQNFLENNNSASDTALKVLDFIRNHPSRVAQAQSSLWRVEAPTVKQEIINGCKSLILSDTIIISILYPESADENWKFWAMSYLMAVAGTLFGDMFIYGLPMRGVIIEGDFVFVDTCMAGKAIVDAHRLCQSLDFSGIVFHESLKAIVPNRISKGYAVPYVSPLNNSTELRLYHFNWLAFYGMEALKPYRADIEFWVNQSFWEHGKDCPLSVDSKLQNTTKLFRRLFIETDRMQVGNAEKAQQK